MPRPVKHWDPLEGRSFLTDEHLTYLTKAEIRLAAQEHLGAHIPRRMRRERMIARYIELRDRRLEL